MQKSISDTLNEILKTTQSKSYFIAFATFGFVVLMVLFGILPAYSAFIFQSNENGKRDDLINKLDTKLTISKNLTTEYSNKSDVVNYFNQIFPNEPQQDNIIQVITTNVNKESSFLQSISFIQTDPDTTSTTVRLDPKIKKQVVSVLAQGSQSNLMNLVTDFENSGRIFNIKDVILSRKTDQELTTSAARGDYKLTIQMNYYYYDKTAISQ